MRTIFFGSGSWGYRALEALIELGADIAAVFTFDADPHECWEHDVGDLARRRGLELHVAKKLGVRRHLELFRALAPEIGFVVGWRTIIPDQLCAVPSKGLVGIHASLLPRYRGCAPINWAIIEGERRTGVTLFYLSSILDGGDIIGQRVIEISRDDSAGTVAEKAAEETSELIRQFYPPLRDGCAPRIAQDHSLAFYRPRRTPDDGQVDWSWPADRIYDWVRALTRPYPGAFTYLDGRRVTVWRASTSEEEFPVDEPPGTILDIRGRGALLVATGEGSLLIEEVDPMPELDSRLAGKRFGPEERES